MARKKRYEKVKKRSSFKTKLIIFLVIIIALTLFIRANNPKQIDDVSPGIACEKEYLNKSEVLWVIPMYEGKSISENKQWCENILKLNKTLGMHGVYHTYREFNENLTAEYIEQGILEFEKCFGYKPELFKAPQLKITPKNKAILIQNNLKIKGQANQIFNKVYHCSNSGILPNSFHDIF